MQFSTSGCSSSGGTGSARKLSGRSTRTVKRGPMRTAIKAR